MPAPTCDLGHHDCASAFLTVAAVEAAAARALGRPVAYDDLLVLAADGHQEARVVVDTAEQPLLSVGTPLRALRPLSTLRTIGTCLRRWAGSGPDFVGDFSSQPPEEVL